MEKVILAYSGGLDTSIILHWLISKGYNVIAYIADVGQEEDFDKAKEKAIKIGASKVYIENLQKELVTDFIFPLFKANALYEGQYLLGTAIARPLIAKKQIEIALHEGAHYVAHGSTGKGNDQIRFELAYYALNPQIKVIAPWKDNDFLKTFKGRPDLIRYAHKHGIEVSTTLKKPYSEDDNILHISHEAGILENPATIATEDIYSKTLSPEDAPDKSIEISITFKDGEPVKVFNRETKETHEDPLELFKYLNQLAYLNGIGRIDMVENRFIGIKSRGIYETPGGTILLAAHRDIEGIAMDREVMRLRDMLMSKFTEIVYNGFWFSPEMDFLLSAINTSQKLIDGTVFIKLYKGNVIIQGRESHSSLYDKDLSSMDIEGGFDQKDSEGFIKIHSLRLKAHSAIIKKGIVDKRWSLNHEIVG